MPYLPFTNIGKYKTINSYSHSINTSTLTRDTFANSQYIVGLVDISKGDFCKSLLLKAIIEF